VILNQKTLPSVLKTISEKVADGSECAIKIVEKDKARSALQNGLYWHWVTRISQYQGEEKEQVHAGLKALFLMRIYERDDPLGFGEMMLSLRLAYKQDNDVGGKLHRHVVKLTSTTKATVKQMQEYLTEVERYGVKLGADMSYPHEFEDIMR